ncbi:unnamed protein product [Bursaphelenchus okinawaensis]|uniref:DDE_3 domain-containing protein n=1 Tax=Bursaphelenchus okinawaensis TaxID=465554 RepID=A0A811KY92_9BILA|nr:unnamed protein product [Bursaphelenchus okinawaensis]CAG9113802.1 unnamed protein product [Bursaphelenchus okinawaensis]
MFPRTFAWLDNLVTGDEEWVLYVNHTKKKHWLLRGEQGGSTPKPGLHQLEEVNSVSWNSTCIVYWEMVPHGTTIPVDVYCRQIKSVAVALHGKKDRVFFIHDTARAYVTKLTQHKLKRLGWAVMLHSLYSTDVTPTDYNMFYSLQNHLNATRFDNRDDLKRWWANFFNSQTPGFYRS